MDDKGEHFESDEVGSVSPVPSITIYDSVKALEELKWPTLLDKWDKHVNQLIKRCTKGHCLHFFKN